MKTWSAPMRVALAIAFAAIVMAVVLNWSWPGRAPPAIATHDIVVVSGSGSEGDPPTPAHAAPAPSLVLPGEMLEALKLPQGARLKETLSDRATGSILCGEVSPDGGAAPYRRFVFNSAARTGAVDDGTELFRRFANKICRQH